MAQRPPARWFLSRQAQRDLDVVWDYIAEHGGASRADGLIDRVHRRLQSLAERPYSGRSRDELRPGWRSAVVQPYVIGLAPVSWLSGGTP
jgi:plasmid stabilization system protein ParE